MIFRFLVITLLVMGLTSSLKTNAASLPACPGYFALLKLSPENAGKVEKLLKNSVQEVIVDEINRSNPEWKKGQLNVVQKNFAASFSPLAGWNNFEAGAQGIALLRDTLRDHDYVIKEFWAVMDSNYEEGFLFRTIGAIPQQEAYAEKIYKGILATVGN
jgi:hypothetical protein